MKNIILFLAMLLVVAIVIVMSAGCRSVEVEDFGVVPVVTADGQLVLLPDGRAQTVRKGWRFDHNQHWMATDVDSLEARVNEQTGNIEFKMGRLATKPSEELNKLVDTSLKGASELAAKIAAAVATAGGSVAGEAGAALLKDSIASFIAQGGDAANATVTCADGSCTISDGTVTEVCENCFEK